MLIKTIRISFLLILLIKLLMKVTAIGEKCIANDPCLCYTCSKETLIDYLIANATDLNGHEIYNELLDNDLSQVVDCSNQSLRNIPKFKLLGYSYQPTVDCLDLSRNDLDLISESLFYGLILRCIDFSHNSVTRISRNAFKGLFNSLSILKLNNNQIKSDSAFPAYFISKLSLLQILDMSSNRLDKVPDRSFQTMFAPSLRLLDLSNNTIDCISDDAFEGAGSITHLNLCHNNLGSKNQQCQSNGRIKLDFLKHLKQLENLQLCWNNINILYGMGGHFHIVSQLRILNIANNKIMSISKSLCSLKNLKILNLASNEIERIEANDLNCLANLNELYMQSNKLTSIDSSLFRNLTKLKILRLDDNPGLLRILPILNNIPKSIEHISINIKDGKFDEVIDSIILENGLINLKTLNLSHSVFSNSYLNLVTLLLSQNSIQNVICHNCSIRNLTYKYNIRNKNEVIYRYKRYACERELNKNFLNMELDSNIIVDCHPKHKLENTTNCFIEKLIRLINITNLYCKAEPVVDWNSFNTQMMRNISILNNCKNQQIDCSLYYKKTASKWKSIFSRSNALLKNKYSFLTFLPLLFIYILSDSLKFPIF